MVRIRDTKHLERIAVSQSVLEAIEGSPEFEILGPAEPLRFDAEGNLLGEL